MNPWTDWTITLYRAGLPFGVARRFSRWIKCFTYWSWEVANYSSLCEECMTCNNWSPMAQMWADRNWCDE